MVRINKRYYYISKQWLYFSCKNQHNIIYLPTDLIEHSSWYHSLTDDLELLVSANLRLPMGTQEIKQTAQKVKEFYFGDKSISKETWPQLVDVSGNMHQHSIFML
jgi:hypothetical protein